MINPFKSKQDAAFEWIDIVDPTNEELMSIAEKYHLHPASIQDCLQPEHLPKYELIDETHFIICRYYDDECQKNADSIQGLTRKLAIFFTKEVIITIHRKAIHKITDVIEQYQHHGQLTEVVSKLVKACLSSYEDPLNKLDAEIEFYESRVFLKKKIPDLLKNLYLIKRKVYIIRKMNNISKDIVEKVAALPSKKNPYMQDLKDYYVKMDTQLEEVTESIHALLNIYLSISSQRTNDVMRTLTVFTAFFLPLTFIVGVYGMNFKYMPELEQPWGYPGVISLMFVLTVVVWIWFKRRGWM